MLIDVKNLKKEYTNEEVITKVLHGLDFNIEQGEFVSIMGPSGSGKSTLMHILGLLEKPTEGTYKFNNKNVENLDDTELARLRNKEIGFVFQSFNLLAKTTVLENVKLPMTYSLSSKNPDEAARKVLKSVGLSHRLHYFTNQISGGEKQRVAIARALVNGPSIIFADEPTGNLDSKSGVQIMDILEDLNKEGNTIILVTHESHTAEYAKRIIKLKDGQIIDDYNVHKRRSSKDGKLK